MRHIACWRCGTVKRERLDFLADNLHFTKRFAFYVGRRCAQASIRDVAKELKLDSTGTRSRRWRCSPCGPRSRAPARRVPAKAIGVDEISIRKGHSYRIVVRDLVSQAADLVRWHRSFRGQHVLCLAGAQKEPSNQARRDGYVKAVPQCR